MINSRPTKKIRIISMLLMLLISVSLVSFLGKMIPVGATQISSFTDIYPYLPKYENALLITVEEYGILNGVTSTTFCPANYITRADTIVALCRVFNADISEHSGDPNPFLDVPSNKYYTNYVKWAYYEGIINGTSPTTFNPTTPIERRALCLVFYRFANKFSVTLSDNGDTTYQYMDDSSIGNIYKTAVYRLYRAGMIDGGANQYFHPTDPMKRIYFCAFLYRYYSPETPDKPNDLWVTYHTDHNLSVFCTAVTCDEYEFRLNNGTWHSPLANQNAYAFSGLEPAHTYKISVRAKKYLTNSHIYSEIYDESFTTDFSYEAELVNYFDKGYYKGYGESQSSSINAIDSYSYDLSQRYKELFGLELSYNAEYYPSQLDICKGTVTTSNISSECSHTLTRHDFLFKRSGDTNLPISSHFINYAASNGTPGSYKLANAYWSNHSTYYYSDLTNHNRSCKYSSFYLYIYGLFSNTERTTKSEAVLMHEFNHFIGAIDHYHERINPNDPSSCIRKVENGGNGYCSNQTCNSINGTVYRPSTCIMNSTNQNISSPTIICNSCYADIKAHLENHNRIID